jgi:hypothetical protein
MTDQSSPEKKETSKTSKKVSDLMPPGKAEELIKDAIHTLKKKEKKDKEEFTVVKKRINGTFAYIDMPSDIKEWNEKKYGYQLTIQRKIILIRIIPRTKYSKHLLSHEELERRLLLIKRKDLNLGPVIRLTENPFDVLERRGKLVKLSEKAIREGVHLVMSHYENPEECEDDEDYVIDFIIRGSY